MKTSKFTETQIILILKQADGGVPVKDVCRQASISVATYYKWKSKYGGLKAPPTASAWQFDHWRCALDGH